MIIKMDVFIITARDKVEAQGLVLYIIIIIYNYSDKIE